jgi:Flp pilus assembly protein TadD
MVALRRAWIQVASTLIAFGADGAAEHVCAPCHPAQVNGYRSTGMGNSLGRPGIQGGGSFLHPVSGSRISVEASERGMVHRVESRGKKLEYPVGFFIGSGKAGSSYAVQVQDRLFQSPVSYYASKGWDVSPGYEQDRELDFDRPITAECLFCHSGEARSVPETSNRYRTPIFGAGAIHCDRCHGEPGAHLRKPQRGNIVNPVRLPARARDSVCEQCHLSGEARILHPGSSFEHFRPGMELERVFSVYVAERPSGGNALRVVSHAEQMAASECAQKSGDRLWCGTCHDPHQKPADPAAWFRSKCMSCHDAVSLVKHPGGTAGDCVSCHMPKRGTEDVRHTAFTDHRIVLRPAASRAASGATALSAWRVPDARLAARNLGLAYVAAGQRDNSPEFIQEGFRLLASVQKDFMNDGDVLTALGQVLVQKQRPKEASALFARVVQISPDDARQHLNLAASLLAAGDLKGATLSVERAISLDASLKEAAVLAVQIYRQIGRSDLAAAAQARYEEFMRPR